jgi:outer membrane protein insertion porin family
MLRKEPFIYFLLLLLLSVIAASCSNTRHIPAGDSLYVGSNVTIKDKEASRNERKLLINTLEGAVRPKPNSKFLGMRLKLSMYNLAGNPKKNRGIRKWLRTSFGEPPVLASTLDLEKNKRIFESQVQNRGFFYSRVEAHTSVRRKKTHSYFDVWTGPQYKMRNVTFPLDSSQLSLDISETRDKTLLKSGLPYNLDLIKGERDRITKSMTEQGYYYFKSDYILVKADTSVGGNQVDMYVTLKQDEVPAEAYQVFRIHNVFVYPNYRLNSARADTSKANAEFYHGYYVVDPGKTFRPLVFSQAMQFQPDEIYNRTEQNISLNRLVTLGTFKFVKNRFDPVPISVDPMLDVYYYLTPFPKKSIRFEIGAQTQTDSRVGSSASITWRNRNAFRGAELLSIKLRGGYEAQGGGTVTRPPTVETGVEVALSIPRFLIPFIKPKPSGMFIPRTNILAAYDVSARQSLYLIHSIKGAYGYIWKENIYAEHKLYPVNVNYVKTDTLGVDTFNLINYSNLIFNGLIIGPTYEFTYNSQATGLRRDNYYFNGQIDFSGNILGLVQGASQTNPQEIFGTQYAQYMKYQVDGRYYRNYSANKNDIWANRIILGFGYPYGNSRQLPNIKQFFSGGNSSLRGFRSRLVGPGTYNEKYLSSDGTQTYIETLGDIKLEINTELRTNIYSFVNSAVFIDAGNIWTYYDDPRFPGGKFTSNFYKQLAVDAGVGLRLDFKILLLRLDLGFPIRKPWLPAGQEWVFNEINPGSSKWLKENLIFNLAIGYPF